MTRVGAADEAVVRELLERMRAHYEMLINERADAGKSTVFVDFLMAVHNFHKFVVLDVMERSEELTDGLSRGLFLKVWRDTWDNAIDREIVKVAA